MERQLRLIRRLADGRFHSGESLASEIGISRAAIWKRLKKLQEELEIEVHAVPGRGYRLAKGLELLDQQRILDDLAPKIRAKVSDFIIHASVDSTNAWVMRQATNGASSGLVCLAEQQTAGKGRHGRTWVSPFGSNIYLSILWYFDLPPGQLNGLSLAIGIAVHRALRKLGVQGIGLKWPNDILWEERKLAGLLLEVIGEADGPSRVVIGIGVNTRLSSHQGSAIDQPWVDLVSLPGGEQYSRHRLAVLLVECSFELLDVFSSQGLAPLMSEWDRYDLYRDKRVVVQSGNHRHEGIHSGVDDNGALLLSVDGVLRPCYAGELSLRPAD